MYVFTFHTFPTVLHKTWEREATKLPLLPSWETQPYILHGILETVLCQRAGEVGTLVA